MFDPKNQSKAAQIFAAYRNENNHLLTKFRNIASYLKKLKELGEFERKEVVGGMFSLDNNLGPVFDSVNINIHRLVEIVDNLIKCLETEKKDLDKYMSGLKKATTESESQLEKLLINYNNEQYDYMQQLNTLVPSLIELAENAIGMEDETIADTADGVFKTYLTLENAILNEKMDKDSLYITFEKVLFKLRDNAKYLGDIVKKLDDEKSKNAKFFISNFRSIPSLLVDFEKHRVNCGRDKDKDKLFSDLKDDDAKVKLDNFMKKSLEVLFHGTNLERGTTLVKSDEAIALIIKISDFKTVEKEFRIKFDTLRDKILSSKYAKTYVAVDGGMESLVINLDGLGDSITIKEFIKTYVKDEKTSISKIKEVTKIFKTAIDNSKAFEAFMKLQKIKGVFINDDEDDDGEKIKSDKWNEISNLINSFYAALQSGLYAEGNMFKSSFYDQILGGADKISKDDGDFKCVQFNKILNFRRNSVDDDVKLKIKKLLEFFKDNKDISISELNAHVWLNNLEILKNILNM